MASQQVYEFVVGDTSPSIPYKFGGVLSFYSFIHFDMFYEDGRAVPRKTIDVGAPANNVNAVIDDPVLGIIRFLWVAGELDVPGHHTARLTLVAASDSTENQWPKGLPIKIIVTEKTKGQS